MSYIGDYAEDYATLNKKFTTRAFASGVPTVLLGTPVISVYKGSATATEKTSAETYITLTVDFDSKVGYNNVLIDLSGDVFFETGEDYSVVITTGTVGGVSVVGEEIFSFSIENRSADAKIDAGVTLAAGAIDNASLAGNMEIVFETDFATNYNTITNAWETNFTDVIGTLDAAALGGDCITADKIADNAFIAANFAASSLDGKGDWNTGKTGYSLTATTGLGAQTANITGNISGSVGSVTGAVGSVTGAVASVTGAVGSVTGAVGSVTGNVGGVAGTLNTLDDLDTAQDLEHAITQDLVGNISSGSAALGQNATSVTATAVNQTLTYTATHEEDGSLHELAPPAGTLDIEYLTTLPDSAAVTSVTLFCYVASNGDSVQFQFWDWTDSSFKTELTQAGSNGTTLIPLAIPALAAYTGTGASLGQIRFRVFSAGGTVVTSVAIDRLRFEYSVVQSTLGFVGGAVWFDSVNGEAGTATGVGGITRPSNTIADARTIANDNNLKTIHSLPGSTLTVDQTYDDFELIGANWTLAAPVSRQITNTKVVGATTVTGTYTGTLPSFVDCGFGAVTLPACHMTNCGYGKASGTFTGGTLGEFVIREGYSLVAGAGAPNFVFTGLGVSTGINTRGWNGGVNYTLDSDCTLSHEVHEGGTTTVTSGGGDAEIRGTCAALTLVLGAGGSETVRFIGMTDGITVSGAAAAAVVNLHGTSTSLSDTSTGSTVTDNTVSQTNINIECDTALSDYDPPTNAEMEARTPTAAQLAYITDNAATAVPVTFTTSGGTTTNAVLALVDGASVSSTNDQYNGRLLVFNIGTLNQVVTDITDYDGSNGHATITAIPFAPTASHTARLV